MATGQERIFNKISNIEITSTPDGEVALLSAVGSGSSLNAECGKIGSSFSLVSGGKESVFFIAKGSLSSVSFYKSKQNWLLWMAVATAAFGLFWGSSGTVFYAVVFGLAAAFLILYLFLRVAKLEFESSGGKTVSFQFSGSAARRASDMAKFCTAAIMIDREMETEVSFDDTESVEPNF